MKMFGRCAVTALALLAVAGCKDGPTGPTPGELTMSLATAGTEDRAIVVSVSGPGEISAVQTANPGYTVHSRIQDGSLRAVVFGQLSSGPLVRFTVSDVGKADEYTALVLEVADATNSLRPVASSTLSIAP